MNLEQLKFRYHLAIVVALGVGFALGYTLKEGPAPTATRPWPEARSYDADFPGCRQRYLKIKEDFAWGDYLRTDYRATLALLDEALAESPAYLPYHALRARIYEEWLALAQREDLPEETRAAIAENVGLSPEVGREAIAERCRAQALAIWEGTSRSPLVADVSRYGDQWRIIRQQHLNALQEVRSFQLDVQEGGFVDLTPAYHLYGLTVDHDRYVNNLSRFERGPTWEEKLFPDVLYCPQHPDVGFQFPCLPHLSASPGRTQREDVEFFCTALAFDNHKLDIQDVTARKLHLLCFNVTLDQRPVKATVRLEYAGREEYAVNIVVGPWRQSKELLRDRAARRALDAAFRAEEVHLCNGDDLEQLTSPVYLYHVAIDLLPDKPLDKIGLPRHDPTTVGLEDEGIRDIRIVAMTVQ